MHRRKRLNIPDVKRGVLIIISLFLFGGCAYYNTMFNALEKYDSALTRLNQSTNIEMPQDIRKDFELAIDKCWKLINIYGEDSNYADDALLLIAKSHFNLQEYTKSERFARQMILKYPESELVPEGNLWLAKSLVKLNRGDEAIASLNAIIDSDADDDLRSRAWFSLGELYHQREQTKEAIDKFETSIEYAEDDLLVSRARYMIGLIYFEQKEYEPAAEQLKLLYDYDEPIGIIFESQMLRIDALLKLDDPDEALFVLKLMGRETRFFQYQHLIQSKIGDCMVYDGTLDQALEQYDYTMRIYPRTSGSARAAFGMAEILEHTYAEYDSARKLYLRVKQEDRNSELNIKAGPRAVVLEQYLKLKENIRLDLQELNPDSLAESQATANGDEGEAAPNVIEEISDSTQISTATQPNAPSRPVKKREPEVIKQSLIKNNFALAEFFLLSMQNFDSAEVNYKRFIATYEDTALVPKSYYALYYLYDFELNRENKADSIKKIILEDYAGTSYARQIMKLDLEDLGDQTALDSVKIRYQEAETQMLDEDYADALSLFEEIAENDSGSIWAEKSRYSIAWIYEHKLDEIESAIAAYEVVAKEYPNTAFGKIAKLKIQPPPPEPEKQDSVAVIDTVSSDISQVSGDSLDTDSIKTSIDVEFNDRLEKIERENLRNDPEPAQEDSGATKE